MTGPNSSPSLALAMSWGRCTSSPASGRVQSEAEPWGKQWIYFRIRLYVILGVCKAVIVRVMCLHQLLGLRSAGPACEKESCMPRGEEQWPIGGHKNELLPTWVSPCLQDSSGCADLQQNWCNSPFTELTGCKEAEGDLVGGTGVVGWLLLHTDKVSQQVLSHDL